MSIHNKNPQNSFLQQYGAKIDSVKVYTGKVDRLWTYFTDEITESHINM